MKNMKVGKGINVNKEIDNLENNNFFLNRGKIADFIQSEYHKNIKFDFINLFICDYDLKSTSENKNLLSLGYITEGSDEEMLVFLDSKTGKLTYESNNKRDQESFKRYFSEEINLFEKINKNNEINKLLLKEDLKSILSDLEYGLLDFYLDYFRDLPDVIKFEGADKDINGDIIFNESGVFEVNLESNIFKETKELLQLKFAGGLYDIGIRSEGELKDKVGKNCSDFTIFREIYHDIIEKEKQ